MPVTLIISIGFNPSLQRKRDDLLSAAGYVVESVSSMKEAVVRFLAGDFDLVLLCHSMPKKDRDRVACLIRASGSRTPIVSVAEDAWTPRDTFADETFVDGALTLHPGLSTLLARTQLEWSARFRMRPQPVSKANPGHTTTNSTLGLQFKRTA